MNCLPLFCHALIQHTEQFRYVWTGIALEETKLEAPYQLHARPWWRYCESGCRLHPSGRPSRIPAPCHSHPPLSCASDPGRCAAFCKFCALHLQSWWSGRGVLEDYGGVETLDSQLQKRDLYGKSGSSPPGDVGCRRAFLHCRCIHQRQPICLPPSAGAQLPPGGLSPYSPPRHLYTDAAWGGSPPHPERGRWWPGERCHAQRECGADPVPVPSHMGAKLGLKGFWVFGSYRPRRNSQSW